MGRTVLATIFGMALAIALGGSGDTDASLVREQASTPQAQRQATPPLEAKNESQDCPKGQDDRRSDLCAQWKAADAAYDSAVWTAKTYDLSLVGAILGALTMLAAVVAAIFAGFAAYHTKRSADFSWLVGRLQVEASLAIDGAYIVVQDNLYNLQVVYRNTGSTGGDWVGCSAEGVFFKDGLEVLRTEIEMSGHLPGSFPTTGTRDHFTVPYPGLDGSDPAKLVGGTFAMTISAQIRTAFGEIVSREFECRDGNVFAEPDDRISAGWVARRITETRRRI